MGGLFSGLRDTICDVHRALVTAGLITASSGNVSGLDRATGRLVIKPSGVDFASLLPEDLVEVVLDTGDVLPGSLVPSTDLPHHLYLYRHLPRITCVVHTHSTYATALAALEEPIPPFTTSVADFFGGPVPCVPYAGPAGDAIGQAILAHRGVGPAVLLARHGAMTWGETPQEAFLAAQMVEETAKTYVLARSIGPVSPLPPAEVARWYNRFRRHYGQPSRRRPRPSAGWTFEAHGVDLKGTWVPHRS